MTNMPSVLITSANRGLGFEFAKQYADVGWRVYAACRRPAEASELQQSAGAGDRRIVILPMDVTELVGIEAAASALQGHRSDVLLNSAGIAGESRQTTRDLDYASWARVFDVNSMGPARVTGAFAD